MFDQIRRSLWIFDVGFRRMEKEEMPGWGPQMAVFSTLGVVLFGAVMVNQRGPLQWVLAVASLVDLLITQHFVRRFTRGIWRMGPYGPTRARWWIELAALDWTLCVSGFLFCIAHGLPAGVLPAWQQWCVDLAWHASRRLIVPFFVLTIVGYILGLVQAKRVTGRSLELVNFFFWTFVLCATMSLVPQNPGFFVPLGAAFGIVGGVALGVAAVLGLRVWMQSRRAAVQISEDDSTPAPSGEVIPRMDYSGP